MSTHVVIQWDNFCKFLHYGINSRGSVIGVILGNNALNTIGK